MPYAQDADLGETPGNTEEPDDAGSSGGSDERCDYASSEKSAPSSSSFVRKFS